ncbi:MAG TPA: hypothetical protein VHM92_06635 [Allosphingosinicella sp.]|nr:hypothetical protein [Allosphingosinicella sp.]
MDQSVAPAAEPGYLQGLDPPQREAALITERSSLVRAGARTGKARITLLRRFA